MARKPNYYALEHQTGLSPEYKTWRKDRVHVFGGKRARDWFVEGFWATELPAEVKPITASEAKKYDEEDFAYHYQR